VPPGYPLRVAGDWRVCITFDGQPRLKGKSYLHGVADDLRSQLGEHEPVSPGKERIFVYAATPGATRYPEFLSVDARFSKDIKVNPKYSVRLSLSTFNLTNHFNPEAVHNNVADPAFGYFFGHRGRRFTADFDFLF